MARVVRFPTDEVEKLDEEFLYHLNRGAEHLARGEPEQAIAALARATELRPRDPKALGLLGQAAYRLGKFPEAAEAYGRLLQENPQEPGAQVNLGLALLKAARPAEAVVHLERALDLNPEHKRAMGYLGLAWLEQGSVARAREWFERAGRTQMVERCDALLRGERTERKPEEWKVAASVDSRGDAEVERELQDALRILEQGTRAAAPVAANVSPPAASAWTARSTADFSRPAPAAKPPTEAPGRASAPPPQPAAPVAEPPAPPVASAPHASGGRDRPGPDQSERGSAGPAGPPGEDEELAGVSVVAPGPSTFTVGAVVHVAVRDEVLVRLRGLVAVEGQVELAPEARRLRGRAVSESFGAGREAMQRARGNGALVFVAAGRRFTPVDLQGASAHFREDAVFGFEGALSFENGRLAAPGAPEIELVRLSGEGSALIASEGEVVAIEVAPDRPVRVLAGALVGWTGALTPRLLALARSGAEADAVELSGEGRVLLDPRVPLE